MSDYEEIEYELRNAGASDYEGLTFKKSTGAASIKIPILNKHYPEVPGPAPAPKGVQMTLTDADLLYSEEELDFADKSEAGRRIETKPRAERVRRIPDPDPTVSVNKFKRMTSVTSEVKRARFLNSKGIKAEDIAWCLRPEGMDPEGCDTVDDKTDKGRRLRDRQYQWAKCRLVPGDLPDICLSDTFYEKKTGRKKTSLKYYPKK